MYSTLIDRDKSILASVSLTLLVQTINETLRSVEFLLCEKARFDDAEEAKQVD